MAHQSGTKNPTAGPVKTPAPVAPVAIDRDHAYGREGYSNNAWGGASSTPPGTTVQSTLAQNLDATVGDDALALVRKRGAGRSDDVEDFQTREIGAAGEHNVAVHPHMSGASAGPRVPNKLGESAAPLPADPAAK